MNSVLEKAFCIGVAVCLLLNTIGFLSILVVSGDEHRISFVTEHGQDHLLLSHSDDHPPFDESLGFEAKHDDESHEFHVGALTGIIHKQVFKSQFESTDLLTLPLKVPFRNQVFAGSKLYESDIGPVGISTTVLRI